MKVPLTLAAHPTSKPAGTTLAPPPGPSPWPLPAAPPLFFLLQELEKFKFVLEYSIGELRGQLDPKDQALGGMREKVEVSGCQGCAVEADWAG